MEPTERIDIDRFDAWLDQLARGIASPAPDDATDLADAAIWLQQKGRQTVSSTQFERQFGTQLRPVPAVGPDTPVIPLRPQPRPAIDEVSGLSVRALMAAAAAILLAVPMLLLLVRSFNGGSDDPTIPAPMNGLAQSGASATCDVEQPQNMHLVGTPTNDPLLIANTVGYAGVPAIREKDLPVGPPPPSEDVAQIQHVLETIVACYREGDFASIDALYSDDTFLRIPITRAAAAATPASPATAVAIDSPDPVILDARSLPNDRIGVLLEHDLWNAGLMQFYVFVKSERGWLVDEVVYVAPTELASPVPVMTFFKIIASDIQFQPSLLGIPANTDVTLVIHNEGTVQIAFVIPELDINVRVQPRDEASVLLNAPEGTYRFYSDIPGQMAAGLQGVMIASPTD